MNQEEKLRKAFDHYQEKRQTVEESKADLKKAEIQMLNARDSVVRVIAATGREKVPIIYNGWFYRLNADGDLTVHEHDGVIL